MMMTWMQKTRTATTFTRMACLLAVLGMGFVAGADTASLLAQMPAASIPELDRLCAELIAAGPDAIEEVTELLVPLGTGDDTPARYALNSVAKYAGAPGREPERVMVAKSLLEALGSAQDVEVKTFLINQLQIVGGPECLEPIGALLLDIDLCESAAQALLAINVTDIVQTFAVEWTDEDGAQRSAVVTYGVQGVIEAFRKALAEADGDARITIVKALGELRDPFSVVPLLDLAESEVGETRSAALWALADIGDPRARDALAKALDTTEEYERAQAVTQYLLYAQRRSEARDDDACEAVCEALMASAEANVRSAALGTLVDCQGKGVLPDVLAAVRDEDMAYRAAGLELAAAWEGARVSKKLAGCMKGASPEARAQIVSALGKREDKAARRAVIEAIEDDDAEVRLAALGVVSRFDRDDTVEAVMEALEVAGEADSQEEVVAARDDLLRLPGEEVVEEAEDELPEMPASARVALLEILAARQSDDSIDDILAQTQADAEEVRVAAIKALGAFVTPDDLSTVIAVLDKTKNDGDRAAAQELLGTLVAGCTVLETRTAALDGAVQALADDGGVSETTQAYLDRLLLNIPPEGFVALFNGEDLTGWKGLAGDGGNPINRARMTPDALAEAQQAADDDMRAHWSIEDGVLVFDGGGHSLCTARDYQDFEMLVDWKIGPGGDSGIYLRGAPQVQIWDTAQWPEGSGGLYNNQNNPRKPLVCADNPIGEWNTFRIKMIGERVTVHLNGQLVVDNVVMENYWDRSQAIFPIGQIELQSHGSVLYFRNVFLREIPREEGWTALFNGKDLTGWTGDTEGYVAQDGKLVCLPDKGGNIYTDEEYGDFVFHFEFKLDPGANNGLAVRAPIGGGAYNGMELQILENTADQYKELQPYQYHGSIYGIVPAKRGFQKPVGEWNVQEVIAFGRRITVVLNGTTIVDADLDAASTPATMDGKEHKGLDREKGHLGFLGHGCHLEFRDIRIRELE